MRDRKSMKMRIRNKLPRKLRKRLYRTLGLKQPRWINMSFSIPSSLSITSQYHLKEKLKKMTVHQLLKGNLWQDLIDHAQ